MITKIFKLWLSNKTGKLGNASILQDLYSILDEFLQIINPHFLSVKQKKIISNMPLKAPTQFYFSIIVYTNCSIRFTVCNYMLSVPIPSECMSHE